MTPAAVESCGTAETARVDLLSAPWRGVYGYVCVSTAREAAIVVQ